MTLPDNWTWAELRHRIVLTPEEKRVVSFVIAAFLLGAGTKCYRAAHPRPLPLIDNKHPSRRSAATGASMTPKEKRHRSEQRQVTVEEDGDER
jgi:hypothetical protein